MSDSGTTTGQPVSSDIQALLAPAIDSRSSWRELFMLPLAALLLAMLIGALIMMATSVAPATIMQSFVAMARGSVGSLHAVSETLTAAIPLVLAGLGIGLAFRAGLFNIGAEGQMVVGGLATAIASLGLIQNSGAVGSSAACSCCRPCLWRALCGHRRRPESGDRRA